MEGTNASELTEAIDSIGDCESTIEIKIKTLDSNTYTLRVDKCVPVPQLKEEIANVTGIVSEQQRLICRGRVLKDNELLSAYHVEDGHTLHLVVRQPDQPSSQSAANRSNEDSSSNGGHHHSIPVSRSIVVEAISIGRQSSEGNIDQILDFLSSYGATAGSLHSTRSDVSASSASGSPATGHLQPNRASIETPSDSLTTISQYLNFLRDEFRRAGFNATQDASATPSLSTDAGSNDHENSASPRQQGFPSATSLIEVIHSTRQLLAQAERSCFSQLPRELEDREILSDPSRRANLQATALRSGVFIQNLGYLLLELGRTTTMLRIGQTTAESVVNAGPAMFISPSGPNPLMVPYFPGSNSLGTGVLGRTVHVSTNSGDQFGPQLSSEQPNAPRSSLPAGSFGTSQGGRVRLIPVRRSRTVVAAVPSQNSRPPPGSSGGGVGFILPVRVPETRDQRPSMPPQGGGNSTDHPNHVQSSQSPGDPLAHNERNENQGLPDSLRDRIEQALQGILGLEQVHIVGEVQVQPSDSGREESFAVPAESVAGRTDETPETAAVSEDGIHFSNLLRQVMPYILHGMASEGSVGNADSTSDEIPRTSSNNPGGSRHESDPGEEPDAKRQRTT